MDMDIIDKYIGEADVKFKDEKEYKVTMFKFKEVKKKLGDAEKMFKREDLKGAQMLLGALTRDIKELWKSI